MRCLINACFELCGLFYGVVQRVYNFVYDVGILSSWDPPVPIIGIGSLSIGGSGKTPFAAMVAELLKKRGIKAGIVSHGYKQKSKRCVLVPPAMYPHAGDEAVLLHLLTGLPVVSGKDRRRCIENLLNIREDTRVLIADDILQHRRVNPTITILLTSWDRPFWRDRFFPAGRLRDGMWQLKRVDAIVITYTPASSRPKDAVLQTMPPRLIEILTARDVRLFTAGFRYESLIPLKEWIKKVRGEAVTITGLPEGSRLMLVSGIAQSDRWIGWWNRSGGKYLIRSIRQYPDHYRYRLADVSEWVEVLKSGKVDFIILTEKDAVRIFSLLSNSDYEWVMNRIYVHPLRMYVLEKEFESWLRERLVKYGIMW